MSIRPSGSQSMLKGMVCGARRAITSRSPSPLTASTSPAPQLHSQARPSCHRVDSGKPRPSTTTRVSLIPTSPLLVSTPPRPARRFTAARPGAGKRSGRRAPNWTVQYSTSFKLDCPVLLRCERDNHGQHASPRRDPDSAQAPGHPGCGHHAVPAGGVPGYQHGPDRGSGFGVQADRLQAVRRQAEPVPRDRDRYRRRGQRPRRRAGRQPAGQHRPGGRPSRAWPARCSLR